MSTEADQPATGDHVQAETAHGLFETLNAIAALMVPSDEVYGGAAEAAAAAYIVRALSGEHARFLPAYVAGIAVLESHCRERFGRPFAELDVPGQEALLSELAEDAPWFGGGGTAFVDLVRRHVIEGTFCDPRWGGNAGGIGWKLLGYGGPRFVWTGVDQEISKYTAGKEAT